MATAETVIAQIQTYMATLSGIREASSDPQDAYNADLISVGYLPSSIESFGPGGVRLSLGSFSIQVLVPAKDLARDHQKLIPFVDSVPNLLEYKFINDNRWNGTVETIGEITVRWTTPEIDGVLYRGYEFMVLNVKREITLTA